MPGSIASLAPRLSRMKDQVSSNNIPSRPPEKVFKHKVRVCYKPENTDPKILEMKKKIKDARQKNVTDEMNRVNAKKENSLLVLQGGFPAAKLCVIIEKC